MDSTITRLLADLLNIPDWAPRALRRTAALTLAAAALLVPTYFQAAFALWAHEYSQVVMERMQPILDSLTPTPVEEPAPAINQDQDRDARDRHGPR